MLEEANQQAETQMCLPFKEQVSLLAVSSQESGELLLLLLLKQ